MGKVVLLKTHTVKMHDDPSIEHGDEGTKEAYVAPDWETGVEILKEMYNAAQENAIAAVGTNFGHDINSHVINQGFNEDTGVAFVRYVLNGDAEIKDKIEILPIKM